jgi:hypothetical protein
MRYQGRFGNYETPGIALIGQSGIFGVSTLRDKREFL